MILSLIRDKDLQLAQETSRINNEKLQAIIDDTSLNDFRSIFESIAKQHTDSVYYEIKERVMNDRIVKADDVLIL
jgi:DNA-directed RNA polymerase beta' subunit